LTIYLTILVYLKYGTDRCDKNNKNFGFTPLYEPMVLNVGDSHNRIEDNMEAYLLQKYYYNTGFPVPNIGAFDLPVKNH
jgi:hypothetical protein